jgi:sugar lactone lactonase YvrE
MPRIAAPFLAYMRLALISTAILLATAHSAIAQEYIYTFAGNGSPVDAGNDVSATAASFRMPAAIAADKTGNIYVSDCGTGEVGKIRMVDRATNQIRTIAGGGAAAPAGQIATAASLACPAGLAYDADNNLLYISESGVARRISVLDLNTQTIAIHYDFSTAALPFSAIHPAGLALDDLKRLYVSDFKAGTISGTGKYIVRIGNTVPRTATIFAGSGIAGFSGDKNTPSATTATSAKINAPLGLAIDPGNQYLYFADNGNIRVRRIAFSDSSIETVAGTSDASNSRCYLAPGRGDGGLATEALLCYPTAVAFDQNGDLLLAEGWYQGGSGYIRRVAIGGNISVVVGDGNPSDTNAADLIHIGDGRPPADGHLFAPIGLLVDADSYLYIVDQLHYRVRKVGGLAVAGITAPDRIGFMVGVAQSTRIYATAFPAATLSVANAPSWLTFNPVTGELAGTPPSGSIGTHSVQVTATNTADSNRTATKTIFLDVGKVSTTVSVALPNDCYANPKIIATIRNQRDSTPATSATGIVSIRVGAWGPFTAMVSGGEATFDLTRADFPGVGPAQYRVGVSYPIVVTYGGDSDFEAAADAGSTALNASLVECYYQSILRRPSEPVGKAAWQGELARMQSLAVDANEVYFVLAGVFFNSAEYKAFNRTDTEFVTDLYNTFLMRAPDGPGLANWLSEIAAGKPRNMIMYFFLFSDEFKNFMAAAVGNSPSRAEVYAVVDYYRGLLGRLADDDGFRNWRGRFRAAQCSGAPLVNAEVTIISQQFLTSSEYQYRNSIRPANQRTAEYVADLYYAFLRRGGELSGFQFWVAEIDSGRQTRDQVRSRFVQSSEFQSRVGAIIGQGCAP